MEEIAGSKTKTTWLINKAHIKTLIKSRNKNIKRIDKLFLSTLNFKLHEEILGYCRLNGSKKTLTADVFKGVKPANRKI